MQSQQWGRKAAAAKAIISLCKGVPDALKPHTAQLVHALVQVPSFFYPYKVSDFL